MTLDKAMENESCGSEVDMTAEEKAKQMEQLAAEMALSEDQQYQCLYCTVNPGQFEKGCHILAGMRANSDNPERSCGYKPSFENDLKKMVGETDGPVTHGVVENLGMGIAESFLQIIKDRKEYESGGK